MPRCGSRRGLLLAALTALAWAAAGRPAPGGAAPGARSSARALHQADPDAVGCKPGFYLSGGFCHACGFQFSCAGGQADRVSCGLFEVTLNDTSSSCQPVDCNPCAYAHPTVWLTTGAGSTYGSGIWRISNFSETNNVVPEFICHIPPLTGQAGDIAVLSSGDVLIVDTAGNLYDMSPNHIPPPNTNYNTTVCGLKKIATLPSAGGYTGLSTGWRSNVLYGSTADGSVDQLLLSRDSTGNLKASIVKRVTAVCDPAPIKNTTTKNSGGTDLTPGPDGALHRLCSRDAAMTWTGTRFNVDATGAPTTAEYTNRMLGPGYLQNDFRNDGSFCTDQRVVGVVADRLTSTNGTFFSYGYGWTGMPQGRSPASYAGLAPVGSAVGSTVTLPVQDIFRINGASSVPSCTIPERTTLQASVSLQVQYATPLLRDPDTPPVISVALAAAPNTPLCTFSGELAVVPLGLDYLDPPPDAPASVCAGLPNGMDLIVTVTPRDPFRNTDLVDRGVTISCYDSASWASSLYANGTFHANLSADAADAGASLRFNNTDMRLLTCVAVFFGDLLPPSPSPELEPSPSPALEPSPSPSPLPQLSPVVADASLPSPTPQLSPSPELEPSPSPELEPSPSPELEPSPSPKLEPSPSPELEPSPSPELELSPSPELEPSPSPELTCPAPINRMAMQGLPCAAGQNADVAIYCVDASGEPVNTGTATEAAPMAGCNTPAGGAFSVVCSPGTTPQVRVVCRNA